MNCDSSYILYVVIGIAISLKRPGSIMGSSFNASCLSGHCFCRCCLWLHHLRFWPSGQIVASQSRWMSRQGPGSKARTRFRIVLKPNRWVTTPTSMGTKWYLSSVPSSIFQQQQLPLSSYTWSWVKPILSERWLGPCWGDKETNRS